MKQVTGKGKFSCKFHNDCDSCPFVDCLAAATLRGRVILLHRGGWSSEQIAEYLHMEIRKVAKWIEGYKDEQERNEQKAGSKDGLVERTSIHQYE